MSPKQKKIAAKAPPPDKIDAKDFAVLKAEKAKGRGMGLQDESIKPGKVQKAVFGKMIKSAGKSIGRLFGGKQSATATPGAVAMSGSGQGMGGMLPKLLQKAIDDGIIKPASKGRMMKASKGGESKSDKVKRAFPEKSPSGRAKIETMLGSKYTPMKRERLFAGSAARRKEGFKKLLKNVRKAIPGVGMLDVKVTKNSKGGGADMGTKMSDKRKRRFKEILERLKSPTTINIKSEYKPGTRSPMQRDRKREGYRAKVESKGGKVLFMDEMKKGGSVMARGCKLGRKKATKLY